MFIFGIALLVAGLVELVLIPAEALGNTALSFVTFGFIMVFLAGSRLYRGEHDYLKDERSRRGLWALMVLNPDLHRTLRVLLAGLPGDLFSGCRHFFRHAHPPDGGLGQGIPDLPFPEGGRGVNRPGRGA